MVSSFTECEQCFGKTARYRAVLLFGAPGSGKGTQGKIIGSIPGFYHSSTGDIFRSLDLNSEMGRRVQEYSSKGLLVPDELTIQLWWQYMKGMEFTNHFHPETEVIVLDGLPRNVRQAELLTETIDVLRIIHLVADPDKMVERLRRRALKENRIDDANDSVIRRRMDVYERETSPILKHYPASKIIKVEATMSMIGVLSEVVKHLVPLKEQLDREAAAAAAAPKPEPAAARK